MKQRKEREYRFYIEDLLDAIDRIDSYIEGLNYESFRRDYRTVDAVVRNLEVIGEASHKVPSHIKELKPNLPWDEMYYLRNKVTHEYFGIDYEIIWDVVSLHLPQLRQEVEELLKEISE